MGKLCRISDWNVEKDKAQGRGVWYTNQQPEKTDKRVVSLSQQLECHGATEPFVFPGYRVR